MSQVGLTFWLLLVAVSTNLNYVAGFSSGPPLAPASNFDLVCNRMTPNPNNHGAPMGGNGGYFIDISPSMSEVTNGFTYVGGQTYTSELINIRSVMKCNFIFCAILESNMIVKCSLCAPRYNE